LQFDLAPRFPDAHLLDGTDVGVAQYEALSQGHRCLDRGVDRLEIGEYYMIDDRLWLEANPGDSGMLCIGCLEDQFGRRLQPSDLIPAPINLWVSPERLRSRVAVTKPASGGVVAPSCITDLGFHVVPGCHATLTRDATAADRDDW
jgi:hypothetical protein